MGRNNGNKSIFGQNNSNNEVNKFDISGNSIKYAKKLTKLKKSFESRKLKSEKLAKSKKLSKNRNLSKFYTKKTGPSFLIFNIKIAFNLL